MPVGSPAMERLQQYEPSPTTPLPAAPVLCLRLRVQRPDLDESTWTKSAP